MNKGKFYELPEKYKYSITFATKIKPMVSEETDKYLSLASAENLKKFLPSNVDLNKKIDFLAFAGNSFVANRLNLNDDGVSTKEALAIAELFPYSFVDIEHNRQKLAGVILNASFSEFGTDKPLTREQVEKLTCPFNVTIGGIIWRAANPDLADLIEESNNPDSELYNKISISWELAFSDFNLILIDPKKKNFEDGEIISDPKKVNELEAKLRAYGGVGTTDNGKKIGRVPVGDVLPLGVGLTENPAAQVGAIVLETKKKDQIEASNIIKELVNIDEQFKVSSEELLQGITNASKKSEEIENNMSQLENTNVKEISKIMKINSIKDLTDENIKEIKASEVKTLLESEVQKIADDYQAKQVEKENAIKAANESVEQFKTQLEDINKKLTESNKQVESLVNSNKEKEKLEAFSARLETLETKYTFNEKQRQIVAAEVKLIDSDEDFAKYLIKAEVLFENNKKQEKVTEAVASVVVATEKTATVAVVEEALNTAEKGKEVIANAQEPAKPTLAERAQKAFGKEGWSTKTAQKRI